MMLRTALVHRFRHRGFTLLEILLASVLAVMVLAAVYMLLQVTVQQTQISRDAIEVEDLTRGVVNRLAIDLSGTLTPLPPKSGGNSAGSSGTSSASSGSTGSTTTATSGSGSSTSGTTSGSSTGSASSSGTSTGSSSETTSSDPSATDNSTALAADYLFQGGVVGGPTKLAIFTGKVPEALGRYGEPSPQVRPDQRQIIYWLGSDGRGLYRRERPWVTADGVRNAIEDDETASDAALLAEEVVGLMLEYFDGTSWMSEWDGTQPGPDGATPIGPPRAIRITLMLEIPLSRGGEPLLKTVSHVIAVRSAPGPYTPEFLVPTTDGGDNPTTDPSAGSGGSSSPSTPSGSSGGSSSPSTPSAGSGGGSPGGGSMGSGTSGGTRGNTGGTAPKGGGR